MFNVPLAAGLAVVLCLILMGKQSLHYFAGNWIQHFELRDGLFLLALILIALPLMPDQAMWGTVLNPYVKSNFLKYCNNLVLTEKLPAVFVAIWHYLNALNHYVRHVHRPLLAVMIRIFV